MKKTVLALIIAGAATLLALAPAARAQWVA